MEESEKIEVVSLVPANSSAHLSAGDQTTNLKNNTSDELTKQTINGEIFEIADETRENTPEDVQYELNCGHRIITEIMRQNKTTCWPFSEPVDVEGLGLWDYPEKIKEPMWLDKIFDKFETNQYSTFSDFAKDFRLMVENCYRYNTTDHPISKKAKRLEMLFEGKLALLKRDIRESAVLSKTSNGRFATLSLEGNVPSTMRSGRLSIPSNGTSRDTEHDSQPRLVYDFVRCEEATLAEDERLANYRERKQQQALYQQIAAAFVSSLEAREDMKYIRKCHLLPEIGLFLHINESTLRLPQLAMYNLEMSLMIPNDSIYLAKIMTSFLCTYYERSLISQRPPMKFKTWEKRLKQRIEKWFEMVSKYQSYDIACEKLCLGIDFFHSLNWNNPFNGKVNHTKSFLDLSYHAKACIVKALCDNMTTFQGIQNHIASLPCEQNRAMTLGYDMSGNAYTYFPQFCGDDVRIYKHRQYGEPPCFTPPTNIPIVSKTKSASIKCKEMCEDKNESGLNCEMAENLQTSENMANLDCGLNLESSDMNCEESSSDGNDFINDKNKIAEATKVLVEPVVTNTCDGLDSMTTVSQNDERYDNNTENVKTPSLENDANKMALDDNTSVQSFCEVKEGKDIISSTVEETKTEQTLASHTTREVKSGVAEVLNFTEQDMLLEEQTDSPSIPLSVIGGTQKSMSLKADLEQEKSIHSINTVHEKSETNLHLLEYATSDSTCLKNNVDLEQKISVQDVKTPGKRTSRLPKRSQKKRPTRSETPTESPTNVRRSLRKRNLVNYGSMLQVNADSNVSSDVSITDESTPKKRQRQSAKRTKREKRKPIFEEPEEEYGSVDFEMACDSVDSLRKLTSLIEEEHKEVIEKKKPAVVINNVKSLLERLQWLLGELESFETHLEKAYFDAKIRLKKEHDELYRAATTGKAIQTNQPDVDPWEDELLSKNTTIQGESVATPRGTITPPASIYLEESDEESDRELRRSKRKPKRYDSDEDFVVDSEEDSPPIHNIQQFFYDEFDVDCKNLLPAALEELETRLKNQATALEKLIKGGCMSGFSDANEGSTLVINERRTRQRSKQETKVFKKVYMLALRAKNYMGPSLLPLLRPDQSEIAEVIDRILSEEAAARDQRKMAREQEQRRKRAIKQAFQQQNKLAKATQKAAKDAANKNCKKTFKVKSETNMWTPPKTKMFQVGVTKPEPINRVPSNEKAENVMIRLQNGKICQALRFSDGRIAPIVRVDNTTKAETFEDLTTAYGVVRKPKVRSEVPHISLSGNRSNITVLKRSSIPRKQTFSSAVTLPMQTLSSVTTNNVSTSSVIAGQKPNSVSMMLTKPFAADCRTKSIVLERPHSAIRVANPISKKIIQQSTITSPVTKTVLNSTGVSQRLTLPSGQVINLVLPNQSIGSISQANSNFGNKSNTSLGKQFVDKISDNLKVPSTNSVVVSQSNAPHTPLLSETKVDTSNTSTVSTSVYSANLKGQNHQFDPFTGKALNKPLGIATPIQVKSTTSVLNPEEARQNAAKTLLSVANSTSIARIPQTTSTQLPLSARNISNCEKMPATVSAQEQSYVQGASSQPVQIGLQNVNFVSSPLYQQTPPSQHVQLVQTLVAGSVPYVQPVQFVQALPIIQTPVMLVAPSQPRLQISSVSSGHYAFTTTTSSASETTTLTTSSPH